MSWRIWDFFELDLIVRNRQCYYWNCTFLKWLQNIFFSFLQLYFSNTGFFHSLDRSPVASYTWLLVLFFDRCDNFFTIFFFLLASSKLKCQSKNEIAIEQCTLHWNQLDWSLRSWKMRSEAGTTRNFYQWNNVVDVFVSISFTWHRLKFKVTLCS